MSSTLWRDFGALVDSGVAANCQAVDAGAWSYDVRKYVWFVRDQLAPPAADPPVAQAAGGAHAAPAAGLPAVPERGGSDESDRAPPYPRPGGASDASSADRDTLRDRRGAAAPFRRTEGGAPDSPLPLPPAPAPQNGGAVSGAAAVGADDDECFDDVDDEYGEEGDADVEAGGGGAPAGWEQLPGHSSGEEDIAAADNDRRDGRAIRRVRRALRPAGPRPAAHPRARPVVGRRPAGNAVRRRLLEGDPLRGGLRARVGDLMEPLHVRPLRFLISRASCSVLERFVGAFRSFGSFGSLLRVVLAHP